MYVMEQCLFGRGTLTGSSGSADSASPAHRRIQVVGYLAFFGLMALLAGLLVRGYAAFGTPWLLVAVAVAAYLTADLLSGIVHFLADNFGSPDAPFIGPAFVMPFRLHHTDPMGIVRHGFFATNGNNALVCLPVLVPVALFAPLTTSRWGYALGVFTFVMLFAVLLTNQVHKWAHMDEAPRGVRWLQGTGLIISKAHHDVHHTRPHNTYYCIAIGAWNPVLERWQVFERLERLIRRWVPGTDPRLRVEQELVQAGVEPGVASMHPSRD